MSQTTLTSFFNSRKRPAADDLVSSKAKLAHLERDGIKSGKKISLHKTCDIPSNNIKQTVQTITIPQSNQVNTNNVPQSTSAVHESLGAFSKKTSTANIEKNKVPKADTVKLARKELSLGDIRKKLASSSRLAELKATADRLSRGIQELKANSDKKNLQEFKSINVDVPQSPSKKNQLQNELSPEKGNEASVSQQRLLMSPRKVIVSPVKSPSKVPAYIRHASLASTATSLPLPHHYRFLAELFRGMETVVALLFNRNEKITFNKLKPSIQEMLKRNFTEKHMAQIKHLVPDFYNFEVMKTKNFSNSCHKESYELVISPNFPNDIKNMNPTVLLERRRYFYDTLLQLVKKHHAQFLASLELPLVIPDNKLLRWHPEFELEKIPDIEGAKLPEIPNTDKLSSAQDVLAKARELFKCNTKMERALEKLAEARARGLTDQEKIVTGLNNNIIKTDSVGVQTSQPSCSGVTILNPALRNLPASLLEKVKAKQAAKALEAMTRSSESEQKYYIYCRLPDLARTLRNIFVTEKKNVLALNVVLSKLDSSFKSNVSASDLQNDIKLLSEEVPEWIKLHNIRNSIYVKLDKHTDLKSIVSKLQTKADHFKSE